MNHSQQYRTWLDNGDAYTVPRSIAEVADDVESEMELATGAILVSRGSMNKQDTLRALAHLKFLIERADIP